VLVRLFAWRVLFALALALPFFWRLDVEEFHGDEAHWISSGRQALHLVSSGQLSHPVWQQEFYFYSQPQIGKVIIGAAQALGGLRGSTPIYDYDWQRTPSENQALGRVPAPDAILLGRVPGALAGWLSCLLVWRLATDLRSPQTGRIAALLLASHPLWLANSRRAGLDTLALMFGLLASWAALQALRSYPWRERSPDRFALFHAAGTLQTRTHASQESPIRRQQDHRQVRRYAHAAGCVLHHAFRLLPSGYWVVSGIFLGLAAGTKYVGLLTALLAPCAMLFYSRRPRRAVTSAAGGTVALLFGTVVFLGLNPALYSDPLYQLRTSISFLVMQADGMRAAVPEFSSAAWVALQIVDRVIWPVGYPPIVDMTLPEPLSPGNYGTPVVALGIGISLVRLLRWDRAVYITSSWTALVFVLLSFSIPTWWERWHLPLVPPLVLLAAWGLATLPSVQRVRGEHHIVIALGMAGASAQYVAALAMLPSYLGRGFGALVTSPIGAAAHLAALAAILIALVSLLTRRTHRHGPLRSVRPEIHLRRTG
jgi:4-amino-4-deoxy-L-arabinose transferase-like glycosyltransferase